MTTDTSVFSMRAHPAAELFPLMEGVDLQKLVDDIREHGLRAPVVVWRNLIVDGRNRLRALQAADRISALRIEVIPPTTPEDVVLSRIVSLNLHRRHMTTSQRAMVAAKLMTMFEPAAAERMRAGVAIQRAQGGQQDQQAWGALSAQLWSKAGDMPRANLPEDSQANRQEDIDGSEARSNRPEDEALAASNGAGTPDSMGQGEQSSHGEDGASHHEWSNAANGSVANLPPNSSGVPGEQKSRAKAAALLNVSPRSVQDARAIERANVPELTADVVAGNVSINAAKALLEKLPKDYTAAEYREIRKAGAQAKAARQAERKAEEAGRAAEAAANAPKIDGIDLSHGTVEELVAREGLLGAASMIHADPPWAYRNSGGNGAAQGHYDLQPDEGEIVKVLDQAYDLAADNTYLFCWCTGPKLEEWFAAARNAELRWRYISAGYWVKTNGLGSGFHWRGDGEVLLMYGKGKPKPILQTLSNVFMSERTMHSEKPQEFLGRLLAAYAAPGGLVIDLYAGRAPLARACKRSGHRYLGAEADLARLNMAKAALKADS